MNNNEPLTGQAEVAINGVVIPPEMLSEVTVNIVEGKRERSTLGGKFTRPSGVLDTAEAGFTLYLPSMDYMKNIFPGRYNAPSMPQTTGNIIFNTKNCVESEAGPVNIHFTCFDNDNNDVFLYKAVALFNFNTKLNEKDDVAIEVMLFANPDDDGNVARLGTGDLTAESEFDPETGTTVPVTS